MFDKIFKTNNFIFLKKKAISKKQCNEIIDYIEKSNLTFDHNRGYYYNICNSFSSPHPFLINYLQSCLDEYVKKHKFLNNLYFPWRIYEKYHLQKYKPGMAYSGEHMEHGQDEVSSQRLLAWMIYLNDVSNGGQTYWPQQNFKKKPRVGDLIIWPSGWTHSHYGIVSNKETKYIATGWCSFCNPNY